jgi:hypothetical protein
VHELGHSQGRYHVACSGGEGGPDPDYPHEGGVIGVFGYSIYGHQLYLPQSARDYMTYCPGYWISDYGWNMTYGTIATLTSWDYEGAPPEPTGHVLVGAVYEDGSADWWTTEGGVDPGTLANGHIVALDYGDGWLEIPASVTRRPHDETLNVVIPLPEDFELVRGLRYEAFTDLKSAAPIAEVRQLHQLDALQQPR